MAKPNPFLILLLLINYYINLISNTLIRSYYISKELKLVLSYILDYINKNTYKFNDNLLNCKINQILLSILYLFQEIILSIQLLVHYPKILKL